MLLNHFRYQADQVTMPSGTSQPDLVQKLISDLINALASQGQVLKQTFDQLQAPLGITPNLSLADVLECLAGIFVEAVLGTTQMIANALLNVLHDLASTAIETIEAIDMEIHIPIISDILNAIGVPDTPFFDLITWIGAAGVTTIYKIANNRPLFLNETTSQALLAANDWTAFSAVLRQPAVNTSSRASMKMSTMAKAGLPIHISASPALQSTQPATPLPVLLPSRATFSFPLKQ